MEKKIYCLMTSRAALTPRIADILFDTACLMLKEKKERKTVRDEEAEIEGEVRTHFDERMLGSIGGVEFRATLETQAGTGDVKYLVRAVDAESRNKLEWAPVFCIEDVVPPPSRMAPANN